MATSVATVCFPSLCVSCEMLIDEGLSMPFCPDCFRALSRVPRPRCPVCGTPFPEGGGGDHLCGECILEPPAYSRMRAIGIFSGPLLDAVHCFKYRKNLAAGELLGRMMARWKYDGLPIAGYDRVIPVPLHPRKIRERGFNQSLILARQVSREHAIPVDSVTLQRKTDGPPQVDLGKKERLKNVRGVFTVNDGGSIKDKRVLLVDDVSTTGSTVRECARVLMKDGAREVGVITLARAMSAGGTPS